MLLYVDKKKQKRQRIKVISLVIGAIFILAANYIYFANTLHQTSHSLTNYHSLKPSETELHKALPVTIFSSALPQSPAVVLIPGELTRLNAVTIALALSQLSPQTKFIQFTPEVKNAAFLLQLAQIFCPGITISDTNSNLLITTGLQNAENLINQQQLVPHTISYSEAQQKLSDNKMLAILLNRNFSTPPAPQNRLEQEQRNLAHFIADYRNELSALIFTTTAQGNAPLHFSSRNALLQNAALCISAPNAQACSLNRQNSLAQNLHLAKRRFPKHIAPKQLSLLTSLEEIRTEKELQPKDGVLFRYEARESILLPAAVPAQNAFRQLKQAAGLNPDYYNGNMKFYKFKTVEIDLHDKI